MAGRRIEQEKKGEREERPRRLARIAKWLLPPATAIGILTGGININNLGPNEAMAQPARRQTGGVQQEDVQAIQGLAQQAAHAFRDYILTGDERHRTTFRNIYEGRMPQYQYQGQALTNYREFMDEWFSQIETVLGSPQVRPYLDAYRQDLDHVLGVRMEPVVARDFLDAVNNIRTRLRTNSATFDRIDALIRRDRETTGTPASDSDVARMRAYRAAHTDATPEDAARHVLEDTGVQAVRDRYGEHLTNYILSQRPELQAQACVEALRDFMLTGDTARRDEFRRIFRSNSGTVFEQAMTRYVRQRISRGEHQGIAGIALAYASRHGFAPDEFATAISNIYTAAAAGNAAEMNTLRTRYGEDVVDPFINIVAAGMAGRAMRAFASTLVSGNTETRDLFLRIYNGQFVELRDGAYVQVRLDENEVFGREFERLYLEELRTNRRIESIVTSFRRNVLPIAIRDIFTELARENPDVNRLTSTYGSELVTAVSGNVGTTPWMVRSAEELTSILYSRERANDDNARQIRSIAIPGTRVDRGAALSAVYTALATERIQMRGIEGADYVSENFAQLSWLSGTAEQVEAELTRRTATGRGITPDAHAVALRARFPENAGQILSRAYSEVRRMRQAREQLTRTYGSDFVTYISRNLGNLHWVVRPVGQIEEEMRSRASDRLVLATQTQISEGRNVIGYTIANLAAALRDIYTQLGSASPNTSQLVARYGQPAVDFVSGNRAQLAWLSGSQDAVETRLMESNEPLIIRARATLAYNYSPVQLINSYVLGRQGVQRGGLARMDARDSLGGLFLEPVATREAHPPAQPEAIRDRSRAITIRAGTFDRDLQDLNRQLEQSILEPARILLQAEIARWTVENDRIRDEADAATVDTAEIDRLERDQTTLRDEMLNGQEMRSSVELAFAMVHLAETGGDIGRTAFAQAGDTSVTSSDIGSLRRLLTWYRALNPTKKRVVGDIVASVLGRANLQLFEFIGSMSGRGYFEAVTRTFGSLSGTGATATTALRDRYGDAFVDLIVAHRPVLANILESPSVRQSDLSMGENQLYANILIRVYRAIANPREGEDRTRMVQLYGQTFVEAVEAQRAQLDTLANQAAGLQEVQALPAAVKTALMRAYPTAHAMVSRALERAYRRQDASLFRDMIAIYGAVGHPPASTASSAVREEFRQRIAALRQTYGEDIVRTIYENRRSLRFLEGTGASIEQMRALEPALLETLHTAYQGSRASTRANFMESFEHVADNLPGVYRRIAGVLVYNNATVTVGENLAQAIALYRQTFGTNDYLFRQFINFDLLNSSISQLLTGYQIEGAPSSVSDGFQTPEELADFLNSEAGRNLITAGREFYRTLETEYLQGRRDAGIADDAEDANGMTTAGVRNLRSQLSIIDTLYLGYSLRHVSSAGSAFGRSAGRATMNAILTITQRDPYLVGPFVMQVLPAIIRVAQDERTLVAAIEAFNALFAQRYAQGARDIAYSTAMNRRYFLEVFARIGQQLPQVTSTFDHNRMEDEIRLMSERQLMQTPYHPFGYRYRPNFLQMDGLEPLPMLYGQQGAPIRLREEPTMPSSPFNPVPGGYTFDSGAAGTFSLMYDSIYAPQPRMLQLGVGPRYRIGPLGASTIIRELTRMFGVMPVNYSDYWLSADAEAGGYYAYGASTPTAATDAAGDSVTPGDSSAVRTERHGYAGGARGTGRTPTGGISGTGVFTGSQETTSGGAAGDTSTSREQVDIEARETGLPYPVAGIIPLAFSRREGAGLMSARQDFTYEHASRTAAGQEYDTTSDTRGVLETYSRIARERGVDMLVMVGGRHAPELRQPTTDGSEGPILQQERSELETKVYVIDGQTGNAYELAYGLNTQARILNYLYGAADTRHVLASLRFAGREMGPAPGLSDAETERRTATGRGEGEPWEGFDGAAVGFTIPRGNDDHGGDNYSFLALQQLVRSMGDGVAVHEEEAAGAAITNLLESGRARDIYAAFYRGAQTVDSSAANPREVTNPQWAQGTGEVMWRRMAIAPRQASFEARVVAGYPTTIGGRWRYERQTGAHTRYGHGLTAGYTEVDLLREFRAADREAEDIYSRMRNVLVSMYGWGENEARGTGWLVAGSYLYGTLEGYIPPSTTTGDSTAAASAPEQPSPHYASLLTMYWARRHGILAGVQRVPGFSRMYDRIDQAMRMIAQNPTSESQVLSSLADNLRNDFNRDIWRFSLGYGWDGEHTRIYVVGSGEWNFQQQTDRTDLTTGDDTTIGRDETGYANLYGLFLFGRPTRAFAEILGHAYTQSPLVIYEDPNTAGGFSAGYGQTQPTVDLYGGIGVIGWPSIEGSRYQREVSITPSTDHTAALRYAYRSLGSAAYDRTRIERLYGRRFAELVESSRDSLEWMVRPVGEIRSEITRLVEDEDPIVRSIRGYRQTETAEAVRDIYIELRKSSPDRDRLVQEYGQQLVDIISQRMDELDWVLLPDSAMRSQFTSRAGRADTPESRMAATRIPQPPARDTLTGPEVLRLFEQNQREVLYAAADAETRVGLRADMYDVRLASHLRTAEGRAHRSNRYYVMISPVTDRPNARGNIYIGNEEDYAEWREHGWTIGRGVSRVDIEREGEGYTFTFSGDQSSRWLQAARVIGGITLPLTEAGYETYRPEGNWTIGGIAHLFQDRRQDLLGGAMYGVRTFGAEEWQNWQVSFSHRLQLLNTATMTDQLFTTVFFNRTTRQVVFASGDVFQNSDELAAVCSTLSGGQCSDLDELQRTTGGAALTWARADVVTGSQLSVHFLFEAGLERRRIMDNIAPPAEGATTFDPERSYMDNFIFRAGIGVDYLRQTPGSPIGTRYGLSILGARGQWPVAPGNITRPELLRPWASEIMTRDMGWWLMMHGYIQW
jgi:hypothetical protein